MNDKPLVSIVIPTYNRKEKLIRLIESVLSSNYPKDKLEIIVVDDASTDGTYEEVKRNFPEVRIIHNEKELLLACSRNAGIRSCRGDYIFLIDDDNVVDKNCILELVEAMENSSNSPLGIVAPFMYYYKHPNRIWCAGVKMNMITSITSFPNRDKIDKGEFSSLVESPAGAPNAFMIKREVVEKAGLFDDKLFPIHYDEADFGERIKKAGYKIVFNPKAKVWHDTPLPEESKEKVRYFGVHNELRAYYVGRNRILFCKKYSRWWQFLIFVSIFNWLITLYYTKIILLYSKEPLKRRLKIVKSYLKGVLDGIKLRVY
jgi:GT2 family glycosyltransferase